MILFASLGTGFIEEFSLSLPNHFLTFLTILISSMVILINFSFPILQKKGDRKLAKVKGASKVTSKFQVTIPERVREALQVKKGDIVVFVEEGDKIFITTKVIQ